ncbi:hypothetical protein L6452_03510 [Arctium lappa]|uniref:Uncharacterized protein n=1 Tax=Arctium lappa TaxID=4217 RepID=A0ACB9FLT9_ARCLA|nr:hypothetical protein L6452_03510 [Arctium lappa]
MDPVSMVDVNEDEASKFNSSPKKDGAQLVLSPSTVSNMSIVLVEKTVVGPGTTDGMEEGNAVVGLEIDQGHKKEKTLSEGETDNAQVVREVAEREKDEKTKEHKNGEILGGSLKGKGSKHRKGNKKKMIARKASEVVIGDSNEGNATVAAKNEGLTTDENYDKEKAIEEEASQKEDVVKEASIKRDADREVAEREKDEKTKEHINGEILGGSSKGNGSKRRNGNKKKKVAQKASEMVIGDANEGNATVAAKNEGLTIDENHDKEKAIGEEGTHVDVKEASIKGEAEEKTEEKKKGEKLGESSNRRGRRPRRNRKKEVAQKASEIVVVDGDKPESSSKKKASEKVKSMGMVFMCSSKTKPDCFRYKILGLPAGKKDQVAKVYKGMRLFLFDVDLRLMYGIFKAAGAGGYNIEPKAFKSAFPSQIRFTVIEDCLPLAEEKFRNVIKENYYSRNKFDCQLNAQQVRKLCKLFVAAKSGPSPKKAIKNHRSGADESRRGRQDAHTARDGKKRKRWAPVEETQPHPPLGRERRRYHDYGEPHVRYEREALPSPVRPVARYLPPPPPEDLAPVRSYGYESAYSYAQRHHDEMVSRHQEHDRERHHLYSREPLTYRDDVYPSVGQRVEYHHHHHPPAAAAALPSQYRLVSREYPPPPATQPADYRLSGGLKAAGYRDVGHVSEYRSSATPFMEYHPRGHPSRYGY